MPDPCLLGVGPRGSFQTTQGPGPGPSGRRPPRVLKLSCTLASLELSGYVLRFNSPFLDLFSVFQALKPPSCLVVAVKRLSFISLQPLTCDQTRSGAPVLAGF